MSGAERARAAEGARAAQRGNRRPALRKAKAQKKAENHKLPRGKAGGAGNGKHADFTKRTSKTPPWTKNAKKSNCFGLEIFSGF
ncbi:hypothetical protein D3Z52_09975 [Clostridiaceae bacterium]|nr:hypothetical protein [Clostridiaceae bacterium]